MDISSYAIIFLKAMLILGYVVLSTYYLYTAGLISRDDANSINELHGWKRAIPAIILFSLIGIFAHHFFSFESEGFLIAERSFIATAAGLICGPFTGIASGLIIGGEELMMGEAGSICGALTTVIGGALGGIIYWMAGNRFPRIMAAITTALVTEFIHLALLWFFTGSAGQNFVLNYGISIICLNALTMLGFSIIYLGIIRKKTLEW